MLVLWRVIEKENQLSELNLHFWVQHVNFPGCIDKGMHWAGDTLRSFEGLMRECKCSHAQSTYYKYSMSKNYILLYIYK